MNAARRALAIAALALLPGLAPAGAPPGSNLLYSNRDRSLAITAWGGARANGALRLHNGCAPSNGDCVWVYRGGLLYSGRDPTLAVKAESLSHGAGVILATGCSRGVAGCTWIYRDGMFLSETDTRLAISALGGARFGTTLKLSNLCRSNDLDCKWSR